MMPRIEAGWRRNDWRPGGYLGDAGILPIIKEVKGNARENPSQGTT